MPRRGRHRPVRGQGLRVDPGLYRDAAPGGGLADDFLTVRSDSGRQPQLVVGCASGDRELGGHQIHSGGLLGDGVLDLDARVDLQEDEHLTGNQEFDGGQPAQARSAAQPGRGQVQLATQGIRKPLRRRYCDDFLVAALDAAVAVAQGKRMRLGPGRRRDDLHLDMAGVVEQRLDEHGGIVEPQLRLGGALAVGVVDLVGAVHSAHPATASAGQRLDHDDPVVGGEECADVLEAAGPRGGRQDRHARGDRGGTRRGLVADRLEHSGIRPHERVPGGCARTREIGVLREEAVARVDQLRLGVFRRGQDRGLIQVGVGTATEQPDRLVHRMHVRALGVVLGVDRDRLHAQFRCSADDPEYNLAAVGDQQGVWQTAASTLAARLGHNDQPGGPTWDTFGFLVCRRRTDVSSQRGSVGPGSRRLPAFVERNRASARRMP